MDRLNFSIKINTTKEKGWNVLWDEKTNQLIN